MVRFISSWYVEKFAAALFNLVEFKIQNVAISLRRSEVQGYMITLTSAKKACCSPAVEFKIQKPSLFFFEGKKIQKPCD
jgi:hypothetical protein